MRPDQIAAVLLSARDDPSPMGLRDHAILQLLSTYGLRDGEITHLRLNDIDWRAETLHIRHSKTGAHSLLPLMAAGRRGSDRLPAPADAQKPTRGKSSSAPRALSSAMLDLQRGSPANGGGRRKPPGKRGPHIFRHARAVRLLRASVPQKIIGDLLGHRSTESTIPYLKLATEDLRAIALEVPGQRGAAMNAWPDTDGSAITRYLRQLRLRSPTAKPIIVRLFAAFRKQWSVIDLRHHR